MTTLEEATEKDPKEDPLRPEERAEEAAAKSEEEVDSGVAEPVISTEPIFIELKVMASTWSDVILRIESIALTI